MRREEIVRRAAPVRKMLSWLREERVGDGEVGGDCGVSGFDMVGRSGLWRNAMELFGMHVALSRVRKCVGGKSALRPRKLTLEINLLN